MSSTAFDFRALDVTQDSSQPLEALVAQDTQRIASATAAVKQDTVAVEIANAIVVTDETYGEAERQIVQWKLAVKQAHEIFDPVCASAFETHRKATSARGNVINPLNDACIILSRKLGQHLADRQREEQQAELRRHEEAKRLVAERREMEIETAEADGASQQEVAALCVMPLPPAALVYAPRQSATRSSLVSLKTAVKARVTNHLALVQHIAGHPQFINLIPVDQSALNRLAAALKTTLMLPGVEVYEDNSTSTRTAAKGAR